MPQGISFLSPDSSDSNRRRPVRDDFRRVVIACRGEVEHVLKQRLGRLFEKADDALYERPSKKEGVAEHPEYLDDTREVRRKRSDIETFFCNAVLESYDHFWSLDPSAAEARAGSVAETKWLEDSEPLEEFAINEMISKAERQYEHELYVLNKRFGHMLSGPEVDNGGNPLAPQALCHRFRQALNPLAIDLESKFIIYKLFDRQVIDLIGGLYDELNSRLEHAGVLPMLSRKYAGKFSGRPLLSRMEATAAFQRQGEDALEVELALNTSDSDTYGILRDLLHRYRGRQAPPARNEAEEVPPISTSKLLVTLSALQRQAPDSSAADQASPEWANHLKLDIERHLAQEGKSPQGVHESYLDVIDLISMMFDIILEDPSLPDAMKIQLLRLRIPVLKTAIMDRSFFGMKTHPARRLLNQLARLAFTWSDDGDRSESSLYGQVASSVDRILTGFDDDPNLLGEIAQQLSSRLKRDWHNADLAEQRIRRACEERELQRTAEARVNAELSSRLGGLGEVPEVVRSLLEGGWKQVLLLTYLEQGGESQAWKSALDVADKLLWSLAQGPSAGKRREILQVISNLLPKLRAGLIRISYDRNRMAALFQQLQTLHIARLRAQPEETPAEPLRRGQGSEAWQDAADESPVGRASAIPDLQPGSWIEMRDGNGGRIRAKLSWKSKNGDSFVFVDRTGQQVAEMDAAAVSELLESGRWKPLRESPLPLVERTLASMVERLSEDEEPDSPSGPVLG